MYHLVDLSRLSDLEARFVRGDANADANVDLSDGVFVLSWLFLSGEDPSCLDAADANDGGSINLSDAVSIFGFLFVGQGRLPAPGPSCGADETDDSLDCRSFEPCRDGG